MKDRLLFVEALETAKCFEEGVIDLRRGRNIGSIMGIGFPANTGGAAQFMTGYQAADPETGRPAGRSGSVRSSPGPTSSPRRTASGSGPRRTCRDLAAKGESFPA